MIYVFASKCDEYDNQVKVYHSVKGMEQIKEAVRRLEEIKKEIEEIVKGAMDSLRGDAEGIVHDVALSTLAYFNAWLVRRGGWF